MKVKPEKITFPNLDPDGVALHIINQDELAEETVIYTNVWKITVNWQCQGRLDAPKFERELLTDLMPLTPKLRTVHAYTVHDVGAKAVEVCMAYCEAFVHGAFVVSRGLTENGQLPYSFENGRWLFRQMYRCLLTPTTARAYLLERVAIEAGDRPLIQEEIDAVMSMPPEKAMSRAMEIFTELGGKVG